MLLAEVERLEKERERLNRVLPALQKERDEIVRSLDIELLLLEQNWKDYDMEKRITLLNFLIYTVEVDLVSPRWLRIRVTWLRDEWGCEQMYLFRPIIGGKAWTKREEDFLKEHFQTAKREFILNRIPNRTWQAIRRQAYYFGLKREVYEVNLEMPQDSYFCLDDLRIMEQEGISLTERNTNWTSVYQLGKPVCQG